ncbi:MAG: type IV secretory system conjugative DNA transfer family protein [Cetobacterium sp.]
MKNKEKLVYFFMGLVVLIVFFTSKLAKDLNYHKIFGKPIVTYKKIKVYVPNARVLESKNLKRTNAYNNNNKYFQLGVLGLAILIFMKRKELTAYGTAKWASMREIKNMDLEKPNGVVLGMKNGKILTHAGPEHLMMMAPTRMGKGINTVLPTLWSWDKSVIVNDIKGECWDLTSGYRKEKFGHKCIYFNPLDDSGEGASYNPLDRIALKTKRELKDVKIIAQTLLDVSGKGEEDHWITSAINLLVGVILHVKYENENASMNDVIKFLTNPLLPVVDEIGNVLGMYKDEKGNVLQDEKLVHKHGDKKLFKKIYGESVELHPIVGGIFGTIYKTPDKERGSILSTCINKLQIFRDPQIAGNISKSDFTPKEIMKNKVSLYLVTPPEAIDMTRALFRLIITQTIYDLTGVMKFDKFLDDDMSYLDKLKLNITMFFRKVFIKAGEKNRILFLIDEFPSLGKLEILEKALAYIAGYGLKVLLITQSINQLSKIYGKENSILDNCHVQMYLTPNDSETPAMISKMLGTYTEQINNKSRKMGELVGGNVSESLVSRPLMTPGEVRTLPYEKVILFVAGKNPILADKIFYFKLNRFKNCKNYRVPTRKDDVVEKLIKLDERITSSFAEKIISYGGIEKTTLILDNLDQKKFKNEMKELKELEPNFLIELSEKIMLKKELTKKELHQYQILNQNFDNFNKTMFLELLNDYSIKGIVELLERVLNGDKRVFETIGRNYCVEREINKVTIQDVYNILKAVEYHFDKGKNREISEEEKLFIDKYDIPDQRVSLNMLIKLINGYSTKEIFKLLQEIDPKEIGERLKKYEIVNEDVLFDIVTEIIKGKKERDRKLTEAEEKVVDEFFESPLFIRNTILTRGLLTQFLLQYDTQNVAEKLRTIGKKELINEIANYSSLDSDILYEIIRKMTAKDEIEKPKEKIKEKSKDEERKELLEKLKEFLPIEEHEIVSKIIEKNTPDNFLNSKEIEELGIKEFLDMYVEEYGIEELKKVDVKKLKIKIDRLTSFDYEEVKRIIQSILSNEEEMDLMDL